MKWVSPGYNQRSAGLRPFQKQWESLVSCLWQLPEAARMPPPFILKAGSDRSSPPPSAISLVTFFPFEKSP